MKFHLLVYSPDGCNGQLNKAEARIQERNLVARVGGRGPNIRATVCCFSQDVSRELEQNWSSWDMSWGPLGTVAPQAAALPTMSHNAGAMYTFFYMYFTV